MCHIDCEMCGNINRSTLVRSPTCSQVIVSVGRKRLNIFFLLFSLPLTGVSSWSGTKHAVVWPHAGLSYPITFLFLYTFLGVTCQCPPWLLRSPWPDDMTRGVLMHSERGFSVSIGPTSMTRLLGSLQILLEISMMIAVIIMPEVRGR